MANHLHQLVILMEAGCYTISNQLFLTGVWSRSPQPPEARGSGGGAPSDWRFLGIYYQNNPFLGIF